MPIRDHYEPGRPCWVDLQTSDLEAARSFYAELFGWDVEVSPDPAAGGYGMFKRDDHLVAGIGPIMAGEGVPPSWTTYLATDDIEATVAAVAANGGTILQPPLDVFDAGRLAVFAGPDGAVAALWQAGGTLGSEFVTEPGGWSWSQLLTRDRDAAIAFYGAVFDWRWRDDPDWGEHFALGDNGEIAGATQVTDELPPEVPPHWTVTFMVQDADALAERATALGGRVVSPVDDMAMGGRTGTLADPQGATFGILSFARPFSS